MNKTRLFTILGAIGVISLVVVMVWFRQEASREEFKGGRQPEIVSRSGLIFADAVGKNAPDFNMADIEGNNVALESLSGRNVVLFFTEGFMCIPCFTQLLALSKDERLNNNETVSFSIVVGNREKWLKILADLPPLPPLKLLFDPEGSVSRLYDTLNLPSSMHKGLDNGHTFFVIDDQGIVRYALDDTAMGVRNDQLIAEIEKFKTR